MRRPTAAIGSAVFFALAPGVVVGLIPWLLTRWQAGEPLPYWMPLRVIGGILLIAGLIALLSAFVRFVVEGLGTPARSPRRSVWSSAGCTVMFATPCTWRFWWLSSARRCCWAGSFCCCTLRRPGWSSRRSSASTRNPPSPAGSARTTRPTGTRACLEATPASLGPCRA